MSSESPALSSRRLPGKAVEMRRLPGKTNGLDHTRLRALGHLRQRSTISSILLLTGVLLYTLSLMWPLASLSPSWPAYPLTFAGIGLILASLKNAWSGTRTFPRRT